MSSALHAVIISWQGQHEQALEIARQLDGHVDRLSVIYSNAANTPEDGPGTWVQVPQSWFFGRKFKAALDLVAPGDIQLQIQADVSHDDWPALIADCAAAFSRHPAVGVWAPDLTWTPWPTPLVQNGTLPGSDLVRVAQTDGVVWALGPAVLAAMRGLDYDNNNLGWGIDWVALCHARRLGLEAVRDTRHRVHHPESRGYHGGEAAQHMKAFLAQLPKALQEDILTLHGLLQDRKKTPFAQVDTASRAKPSNMPLMDMNTMFKTKSANTNLCEISFCGGTVFAKAGPDFLSTGPHLASGGTEVSFAPADPAPSLDDMSRSFPLAAVTGSAGHQQFNDLDEWQVAGWNTLRVVLDPQVGPQTVALGGEMALTPADGNVMFLAELASHRARGALVVVLTDSQGSPLWSRRIAFDRGAHGGANAAGYQSVQVVLPARTQDQVLRLEIDYLGGDSTANADPHVFFVARPSVTRAGASRLKSPVSLHVQDDTTDSATWYRADLNIGRLNPADDIVLRTNAGQMILLPGHSVGVHIHKDWGHVLEFHANGPLKAVAWINGTPAFPVLLEQGNNMIRVPQTHLTGQHSWLELRDPSGNRVYWANWFLPPRQLTPVNVLQHEGARAIGCDLFPQSPQRFKALRAHMENGTSAEDIAQLSLAIKALEAGYEKLKLKPLRFPEVENPDVSIVIPAHNKVNVTYAGLCALLLAWNKASFEVILVDDASTDETATIETLVSGITVIHNEEPMRFIRACNAGAARARGKYVVLLNNDTEPTAGWLDELIEAFDRFPKVGLVGSKLLYPDGTLQDAGGIVWGSGDPWNYGNRQNPHEPRFCYARQADYLSGAALMTTREIWEEVGGLSSYLEPMYFEDTDLSFKVRDAGYTTWFVPSSVVYHYEGMTSGTSTSSGFKRFQEVNRPKFKRRWAKAYANFSKVGTAPDLEKDRGIAGRVLFVDYTTPTPDQSAGSYAALQEIRLVQSLGYKVTFLPENLAHLGNYTDELQKMGVEVVYSPFYRSIDEFLQARGAEFDAFYITRYHVVNSVVPQIRAANPQAPVIMNNADLHYLRLLRKAVAENDEAQKDAARAVQAEEFAAMRSVDVVLSYNEMEHSVIEAQSEGAITVLPCPWVLDLPDSLPPRDGRKGLSFLGGFQHHPNVEGVEWFARSVMSRLGQSRPDIELSIYGSRMNDKVEALESPGIHPIGFVENIEDAYDRHMIFVAPLLSGAGIKGKVLSALAHGIPCILSPLAAEGIGLLHGRDCLIAKTPEDWEKAIIQLYDDPALWDKLVSNARDLAALRFSFESGQEQMRNALEAIGLFSSVGPWAK
ncbi:glycosyltransferase [Tropicibacter oceani]|uniref:Glycosyltransferase n=1 Tax=Tropicibacter oceani TaxID=3058420 RepID=A0ABY8QPN6_9RHOB|nr:glycosyltransferase [Tropicibacter oceani]WGW06062.1 glycosyltransferase [Tropicibacter oceani]